MFTGRLAGYPFGTVVLLIQRYRKCDTLVALDVNQGWQVKIVAPKAKTKDVSIAARITEAQAQRLDEVQGAEPALASRSAAVGRLIDMLTDDSFNEYDAAEGKEYFLDAAAAAVIGERLSERTKAYNAVAKQIRAIGNNLNQLVRLGHQIEIYGKDGHIAIEAVDAMVRQLEDIVANELHRLAVQDAHVEEMVRACLPR